MRSKSISVRIDRDLFQMIFIGTWSTFGSWSWVSCMLWFLKLVNNCVLIFPWFWSRLWWSRFFIQRNRMIIEGSWLFCFWFTLKVRNSLLYFLFSLIFCSFADYVLPSLLNVGDILNLTFWLFIRFFLDLRILRINTWFWFKLRLLFDLNFFLLLLILSSCLTKIKIFLAIIVHITCYGISIEYNLLFGLINISFEFENAVFEHWMHFGNMSSQYFTLIIRTLLN